MDIITNKGVVLFLAAFLAFGLVKAGADGVINFAQQTAQQTVGKQVSQFDIAFN
jgi:hypothetical protein